MSQTAYGAEEELPNPNLKIVKEVIDSLMRYVYKSDKQLYLDEHWLTITLQNYDCDDETLEQIYEKLKALNVEIQASPFKITAAKGGNKK